jgi:hypothetical protein
MAFLIPTGLHAKQLVDFCMMEMSAHEMTADHSCCESDADSDKAQNQTHAHHDCDWGFVCACDIGKSTLDDEEWIPSSQIIEGFLTEKETLPPLLLADELINDEQQNRIGEYDPPLWLLYDTFLM